MKKLLATLVILLAAAAAGAAPVSEYLARLKASADALNEVKRGRAAGEEAMSDVKQWLPASEQVETGDKTITVDNAWLHDLLREYAGEKDRQKRNEKLDEAIKRLEALAAHVDKAERVASDPDSDPKRRIETILARPQFAEKRENAVTRVMRELREKIIEFLRDLLNRALRAIFGAGTEASWLLRIGVVVGILLCLIMVVRVVSRYTPARKKSKKRLVLGEEIEEGVSAADLAQSGLAAARAGDFRIAIRKLYIALLYDLAERNLIEIEPYATNRDYLAKVSRFDSLAAPMRYMTDRFDYCWYGMFPASQEDFSAYHNRYTEAVERAKMLGDKSA